MIGSALELRMTQGSVTANIISLHDWQSLLKGHVCNLLALSLFLFLCSVSNQAAASGGVAITATNCYGHYHVTCIVTCPANSTGVPAANPTACICNTDFVPDSTDTICLPDPCPAGSSGPDGSATCTCNSSVADQSLVACVPGIGDPIQPTPDPTINPDETLPADCDVDPCSDPAQTDDSGNGDPPPMGDPVNPATGLEFRVDVDYHSFGGLEFKRVYNSLGTDKSMLPISFGAGGWRLDWQRSIQGTTADITSQLRTLPALGTLNAPYGVTVYRTIGGRAIYTSPTSAATITVANVIRGGGRVNTFKLATGVWTSYTNINDQLTSQYGAAGGISGWTYTTANKDVEQYNPMGQLLSVTNRAGETTTLTYSDGTVTAPNGSVITGTTSPLPAGRLIRITDAYQHSINLGYDASSRIVKMTDPAGGVYGYVYDTNNNLVSVIYPDNKTRQYLYENTSYPHALTGIIDENGSRFITNTYDSNGRAISTEHAGSGRIDFAYSSGSTTITDAIHTVRTLNFQAVLGAIKSGSTSQPGGSGSVAASSNMTYDANGNIASRTDFNGNLTTYVYDLTSNLQTSRTQGLTSTGAKTTATRTINTTWNTTYRLPASITEQDTSGATAVTLRTTVFNYDPSGNLLTRTITDGQTPTITRIYTYTYDTLGHRLSVNGPRTDVTDITNYGYDTQGNLRTVRNALSQVTNLDGYDANGRPGTITDPNGLVTNLVYDARGRLTRRNAGGEITSYTYDGVGNLTNVTLPSGATYTYTYDAAHRLIDIADSLGNHIHYTLDAMGNRTLEQTYDSSSNIVKTHSRVFDALNRLYQDIGAVNQTTTYAYDPNGNLTSVIDPLTHSSTNAYDALNRLITNTDKANGQAHYGYNALDQLTQVTDPRNLVTQYSRDGLNNLNQTQSPDTGTTNATYDTAGNMLTRTDAKLQTATYAYDALNRVTTIGYTGGTAPAQSVTYQYDQGTNGIGHLTQITDSTGITNYSYDQHGRLTGEIEQVYGATYTTAYNYDAQGRLNAITYPSGRTVNYTFDALGRINQVATTYNGTLKILASNIIYEPFGGVQSFTYGDGHTAPVQSYTRQFDQDGRIASYTLNGKPTYIGYDAASQISFVSDPTNLTNLASYNYDPMSRISGFALGATSQNFAYDPDGNRISQTVGATNTVYGYGTSNNWLTSIQTGTSPPQTVTQDAIGATASDPTRQYGYDVRGRLIQTSTAQGVINYEVNALGLRVRKQVPYASTDTNYHYDLQGHLIDENPTGTSQFTKEYIYLGDQPVAVMQ